ncbi:hypothetical protein E2C01_034311 [Portunus trituberculatus]|uniref:Uncharacterized protein n=1 Tax=Portunus trituberculatus TaxID=210409 RepID=A0A5B7F871_PORTR|nr:hypothetical protein [Portunus trituberculatus]
MLTKINCDNDECDCDDADDDGRTRHHCLEVPGGPRQLSPLMGRCPGGTRCRLHCRGLLPLTQPTHVCYRIQLSTRCLHVLLRSRARHVNQCRSLAAQPEEPGSRTFCYSNAIHHQTLMLLKGFGLSGQSLNRSRRGELSLPACRPGLETSFKCVYEVFRLFLEIAGTIEGCHTPLAPHYRPQRCFVAAVSYPPLCDVRLNSCVWYYEEGLLASRRSRRSRGFLMLTSRLQTVFLATAALQFSRVRVGPNERLEEAFLADKKME